VAFSERYCPELWPFYDHVQRYESVIPHVHVCDVFYEGEDWQRHEKWIEEKPKGVVRLLLNKSGALFPACRAQFYPTGLGNEEYARCHNTFIERLLRHSKVSLADVGED
jgi:hypothetical protein